MKLEEARQNLALYALGALGESERQEVELALERYPELQEELRQLQDVAAELSLGQAVPPPPPLRTRVLAITQPKPPRRFGWGALAAAAAMLVLVWGGWQAWQWGPWIAAFGDPDTKVITLVDLERKPCGRFILRQDGQALIWIRLPPPPSGKTYQLWSVDGSTHLPMQTFEGQIFTFAAPQELQAIHITEEPDGGSQFPSVLRAVSN